MKTSISTLHHKLNEWLRETDFYKQELSTFQKRLEEVAAKNTSKDVLTEVEHFQNKFIIFKDHVDFLAHDLNKENENTDRKATELPEHLHQKIVETDNKLKEQYEKFISDFAELRLEFNKFLSKVM